MTPAYAESEPSKKHISWQRPLALGGFVALVNRMEFDEAIMRRRVSHSSWSSDGMGSSQARLREGRKRLRKATLKRMVIGVAKPSGS